MDQRDFEAKKKKKTDGSLKGAGPYLDQIETAMRTEGYQRWDYRCETIRKRYRYENSKNVKSRKYQLLWSNMEVLKPAVYAKPPVPVVQRRFRDNDPVGRVACQLLERDLRFQLEMNHFGERFEQVRDDYLLYGRGVARVYYEPVTETVPDDPDNMDVAAVEGPQAEAQQEEAEAQEAGNQQEILSFENVKVRYVHRQDFVHEPARTWDEVDWVAFRAYLTRDELIERFGEEIGKQIPMDTSPDRPDGQLQGGGQSSLSSKATIWEQWDRTNQRVRWLAKGWPTVLEESEPYLKLDGFYPCPKPAFATMTNDSLEPIPDYVYYQDQAEEIDTLTARIGALQQSLKAVWFYPGGPQGEGAPELERAMAAGFENKLVAVKSWAVFTEGGKGGPPVVELPVMFVAELIEKCVELRKQLLDDVYQIIGISDIMRGDGNANETATAQSIKAQYGSIRIRERQEELARFARDIIRMAGEIVCNTFQPDTMLAMANMKLPTQADVQQANMQQALQSQMQQRQAAQQAMQQGQPPQPMQPPQPVDLGPTVEDVVGLLRDNALRMFRIDIEADSTIVGDESQERNDRTQFIETVTKYIQVWAPIIQQNPMLAKMAGDMLLFGVRSFRVGRELEETIEDTVEKLEQASQQPPPPDPKMMAEQTKLKATQIKAQSEQSKAQMGVQQAQIENQAKMQQTMLDHHVARQEHEMDLQRLGAEQDANEQNTYLQAAQMAAKVAGIKEQMKAKKAAANGR